MKTIFKSKTVVLACLLMAFTVVLPMQAMAEGFAIIVNSANSASGDDADSIIKNIFLKKQTSWPGGGEAVPLSRSSDSAEQQAFLSNIMEMSQGDWDSYWQAEKSKTGATAPREVGSTNILLRQVSRKEGAIGVVSSADAAALPDGVKVLKTF